MAIQFPSPVADGYSFTAENGVVYTYDSSGGGGWYAYHPDGLNDVYVNIDGDTMTGDLTVPSLNGGPLAGCRNLIINGGMEIDQRYNGTLTNITSTSKYVLDRWRGLGGNDGGNNSMRLGRVDTPVPANTTLRYAMQIDHVNGASYAGDVGCIQGIEHLFRTGQQYTLSFYCTEAPTNVEIYYSSATLGGSARVVQSTGAADDLSGADDANGYRRYGVTFTTSGQNVAGNFAAVEFKWSGGTARYMTGVQLECGPVATPFEHRPIGLELQLCQRYYQILNLEGSIFNGNSAAAGECYISGALATSMRLNEPTGQILTGGIDLFLNSGRYITAGTGGGASQASITGISNCENGGSPKIRINRRGSGDSFAGWTVCIDNDRSTARLGLDAEL